MNLWTDYRRYRELSRGDFSARRRAMPRAALGVLLATSLVTCVAIVRAEEPVASAAEAAPTTESPPDLAVEQHRLEENFARFETLLLRLAELSGPTDPRRAALLRKAVGRSKERLILGQFEKLVKLLGDDQAGSAASQQGRLMRDLNDLLEVLVSEDRPDQAASEKERWAAYLKEVNRLIKDQQSLQTRTQRSADADLPAESQGKLAERTAELTKKLAADAQAKARAQGEQDAVPEPSEAAPGEQSPGEKQPREKPPSEQTPGEKTPSEAGTPPTDQSPSESTPREGDPQATPPAENASGNKGSSEGDSPPAPAQPQLDAAEQRMRQAQQKLAEAQRDGALEEQEQALRELRLAKAELEKILRQLREEEIERYLMLLEERLRQMLQSEREVLAGAKRLDGIPAADRQRGDQLDSARLGRKQAQIALEAQKAQLLLEEDGTAVAFVEVLSAAEADMQQVAQRLASFDVGSLTQRMTEDIVASLEEMLAALEQAQQEHQDRQDSAAPAGEESQEQSLIDQIAELKLIRSLQWRVNRRTSDVAAAIDGEQAQRPELVAHLKELADREQRIYQSTRDIVVGRNR